MRFLLPVGTTVLSLAITAQGDDPPGSPAKPEPPKPLSVQSQLLISYVVGGQEDERKGLWGKSDNFPKPLREADKFGEAGKLSVVAFPDEDDHVGKFAAVPLRIVNRSQERPLFSAIDSHLFIVQEAKNEKGEWKAIERIPHGTGPRDCAVGFHQISLKPGQYWDLSGPRYTGPFKTGLRYRVDLGRKVGNIPSPGGKLIYSNEFEGSIHPEQFTRSGWTGKNLNSPQ